MGDGIPGVRVDGADALAVYEATREAVARARDGKGPTFIEAVTYRTAPHATADDPKAYIVPQARRGGEEGRACVGRYEGDSRLLGVPHDSAAEEIKAWAADLMREGSRRRRRSRLQIRRGC